MEYIDMDNWPRKEHFAFFYRMDLPHFGLTGNLDVTTFRNYVKEQGLSFYFSMIYAASRVANNMECFRYRIHKGRVVLFPEITPSFTYLNPPETGDLFRMIRVEMADTLKEFVQRATDISEAQTSCLPPEVWERHDDLLYVTCIPWISLSQVNHPMSLDKDDAIPRLVWGKYFEEGGRYMLPFSVQAHHALMDGWHVGTYFEQLQQFLDNIFILHDSWPPTDPPTDHATDPPTSPQPFINTDENY